MSRRTALALLLALAAPAAAQVPPDKALATMKPGDGLQVELFAHEPMLLNPTSMDVDHKGRVWVAEAVNYRRKNFNRPILRKEGDRIQVLIDKDGDGKADEAVTFYQGQDLYGPLSVCVIPQADGKALRVLVAQSPDVLEFWDRDGDLKADGPPKKFLTGFGGFDHDHGVHGLNIGPDGKLYFTVGDSGVTGLQGTDKKGPVWKSNTTDVQKGTVWRCDQDGGNLELIAHNFRNNYECCVNSFGEIWLSDNDDDGNQQTRICFVMPGGNYGYGPRGPGQTHWHEEQPGVVHKVLRTGFGSPTGITFYEGSLLPEKYRGQLIHADAGPREIRAFHIKPKGAGYELDKEVILTSSDNWFRPSDVCVGPDGSIFVADWYDPGVGGHGMGDWTRGRVFRITPKGHAGYKVPDVKLDTKEGVLAALASPCLATRSLGIIAMRDMGGDAFGDVVWPLLKIKTMTPLKSMAIFEMVRRSIASDSVPVFKKSLDVAALGEGVATIRAFCSATSGRTGLPLAAGEGDRLKPATSDLIASVKIGGVQYDRELLLLMRTAKSDEVFVPLFYALAKLYDGQDHFYRAALNIACGTDPARRDAILAGFDKHFPEWNETVADLVWELRPKSVLPRLEKLLADAKVTGPQKARIVDILAASDDTAAGTAMLSLLRSDSPPEVKARALDNLRLFLPTKWKPLAKADDLKKAVDTLLADPKTTGTGLQLVAAANYAPALAPVEAIARDEKRPLDVRKEAVRTLGGIGGPEAVSALVNIGSPKNDLSVECVRAIGKNLPAGGKPTPAGEKALESLQMAVTLGSTTPEIQAEALAALAGNRAGTGWLLQLKEQNKMPAAVVADAGRLLRNSPFQGERNRAMILFPAPGKLDPKKLPPLAELAKRVGNADRGKQVWDASFAGAAQCSKCHMVRGVGGQVGPDLSMVGKKGSKENLFESVLDPAKAIADQYIQHQVTTTAEVTVTGLLVSDTPEAVTLRDANGKDFVIPRKEIEGGLRKQKLSIMPQDIAAALTEDELIDLVAYMQTLQTAAYTPDSFRVAGPFPTATGNDVKADFGPEAAGFDPAMKFRAKDQMIGWRTLRPDGKGYFDLAAYHGTAGNNSVSYLYAEFDSPADQDAEVLLGADDGAKLWVNGKPVFTHEQTRAAAPAQDRVPVKLAKGKNAVLLKVANGNNPHGAYFTLLTGQELKPAGAK